MFHIYINFILYIWRGQILIKDIFLSSKYHGNEKNVIFIFEIHEKALHNKSPIKSIMKS